MQLNFNIAAMKIKYHAFSETGPRRKNEDYLRILEFPRLNGLMAVLCDGMGGHNTGDVASKLVAESLCTYWRYNQAQDDSPIKIKNACDETMTAFNAKSKDEMGTTMTMVSIRDDEAVFAHCGDSRIYHIRNGKILYKSHDHTGITPEGWPIVTKAFYTGEDNYEPEIHEANLLPGDLILLCSDGVHGLRKEQTLEKLLGSNECSIEAIKDVASAPEHDNYSAILIEVQGL